MNRPQFPVIIAMKGYPCTGKSTIARMLAKELQWPVVDQDDVRSFIGNLQKSPHTAISFGTPDHLDDTSFEAVCQIAVTQLQMGARFIVDSNLSHASRLERLLEISLTNKAVLVLVECRPEVKYVWRQWVAERGAVLPRHLSYKPSTWDDLESQLDVYDFCENYDDKDVRKFTLDTTSDVKEWQLFFPVEELFNSQEVQHVHLERWIEELAISKLSESKAEPERYHTALDHRLRFSEDRRINDQVNCRRCLEPITGPAYNCTHCDLYLHKSCAEWPPEQNLLLFPGDHPPFVTGTNPVQYTFTETHRCNACREDGECFSYECEGCLFQTHLQCALVPTVLHHQGHKHPLVFTIASFSNSPFEFRCNACGDLGRPFGYFCHSCKFACHVHCGFFPTTLKHSNHVHSLHLTFTPSENEDTDEIYCDACEKDRNPKLWFYNCDQCLYTSHLTCIVPSR